jgi:hypothetical protein
VIAFTGSAPTSGLFQVAQNSRWRAASCRLRVTPFAEERLVVAGAGGPCTTSHMEVSFSVGTAITPKTGSYQRNAPRADGSDAGGEHGRPTR